MGSGGSNRAAEEANRQEQERMASIQATQARINQVFDDPRRAADISDAVGAFRTHMTGDLDRQKADADRSLRFALARSGLMGGSTQVDQQTRMTDDYGRGLLDIERRSQGMGANLEAADQDARARLIGLATSGLDATTAAAQSAAAMRSNLEAAQSDAFMAGLGDMFSNTKQFATQVADARTRRQALGEGRDALYGPTAATAFYYGGGR